MSKSTVSTSNGTFAIAAGAGVVTGMRSMMLPAFLSHHMSSEPDHDPASRQLAKPGIATVLVVLAVGEMIADKTSFIPDRTDAFSLVGRAVIAGFCGIVIADDRNASRLPTALVSSLTAVGSTFLSYTLRKHAGTHTSLPTSILGMLEDTLVLYSASRLVDALKGDLS